MRRTSGLTIVEVLLALLVVGITFFVLLQSQLTNLSMTTRSRGLSLVKATANRQLEKITGDILKTTVSAGVRHYAFLDYYYSCTSRTTPAGYTAESVSCSDSLPLEGLSWTVTGGNDTDLATEGQVLVTVTATRTDAPTITLTNMVSCYDVYPSPKLKTAPGACPDPYAPVPGGTP